MIVVLGATFYLFLGLGAKTSLTNQLLSKQQVLARAEAGNVTSFFQVFGDSVAVLSQLKTITSSNSAIWSLDSFTEQWRDSGLVYGIALTDGSGVVRFNSNVSEVSEEISLSDRDYFLWAKGGPEAGEYFVGTPVISRLGTSKDQPVIPVAAPVYQNGTFAGVLVAEVGLHPLTKHYLNLMKVTDSTDIFLITKNGTLLYSNSFHSGIDVNLFDFLKTNSFSGSKALSDNLKNALNASGEGRLEISYSDSRTGRVESHAMAYSSIDLGGQQWLLVMASPAQDIWDLTIPLYIRLIVLMVLVAVTVFAFGIIAVKEVQKRL